MPLPLLLLPLLLLSVHFSLTVIKVVLVAALVVVDGKNGENSGGRG